MCRTTVLRCTGRSASRFVASAHGNVAVMFAIALVPIMGLVGAAIDYSRAVKARSQMQAALDSTALMLSKDLEQGLISPADIPSKAQLYFAALYTNKSGNTVTVNATYTPSSSMGSTIQVNANSSLSTDFMKVAGFPTIDFGASSTSAWGNVRMRVAMALDNTGSMAESGKIGALRTAASNLVDQLSAIAKTNGDVYISVVPFAKDVNVGTDKANQTWLDWSDWEAAHGSCSSSWYRDQASCQGAGKTWTPSAHSKWTGCVTDRTQPYDAQKTVPIGGDTLFPVDEYYENFEYYCKPGNSPLLQPIMPLSYDWSSIKSTISAMQPTGGTNQPIGLAWAWLTLQQTSPMNAPAEDPNYTYKRAIILLSDGLNTEDRWPSYGDGQSQFSGQIDARQKALCDNIKKDANTTIYTIQVNTGGDPTSSILQYCASSADQFYLITSATQTVSVFQKIGESLSRLRVAR